MNKSLGLALAGMLLSTAALASTPTSATTSTATAAAPKHATDHCVTKAKKLHGAQREEALKKCEQAGGTH